MGSDKSEGGLSTAGEVPDVDEPKIGQIGKMEKKDNRLRSYATGGSSSDRNKGASSRHPSIDHDVSDRIMQRETEWVLS